MSKLLAIATMFWILATPSVAEWNPPAWAEEDTLEFLTVGQEEGEHWSIVWLVVIDGQLYIRLGNKAASRVNANTTAPYVKLKIAGQQFEKVRVEDAADKTAAVAAAMADKYTSDLLIRYFPHPLTLRLVPAEP